MKIGRYKLLGSSLSGHPISLGSLFGGPLIFVNPQFSGSPTCLCKPSPGFFCLIRGLSPKKGCTSSSPEKYSILLPSPQNRNRNLFGTPPSPHEYDSCFGRSCPTRRARLLAYWVHRQAWYGKMGAVGLGFLVKGLSKGFKV